MASATPAVSASPQPPLNGSGDYIYPSPVRRGQPATVVYDLKEGGEVTVKIHNQTGRLVDTLRDIKAAGWQSSAVSLGKFAPGTYYYVVYVRSRSGATETRAPRKFVVLQ
jgi:hypothetical protein